MTDPAVEAAQQAWELNLETDFPYKPGEPGIWSPDAMEAAAREALKPIRDLHQELDGLFGIASMDASGVAAGVRMVLSRLAPLIYTTEEMER